MFLLVDLPDKFLARTSEERQTYVYQGSQTVFKFLWEFFKFCYEARRKQLKSGFPRSEKHAQPTNYCFPLSRPQFKKKEEKKENLEPLFKLTSKSDCCLHERFKCVGRWKVRVQLLTLPQTLLVNASKHKRSTLLKHTQTNDLLLAKFRLESCVMSFPADSSLLDCYFSFKLFYSDAFHCPPTEN